MSNLMITLIAIALTAITAVIAFLALGDEFFAGSEKADYARLQNEANQISIASNIYMSQNQGQSPENVSELVEKDYLKSEFSGLTDFIDVNGESVPVNWEFGFDDYITQLIDSNERCAKINKAAGGSGEVADIPICSVDFDPMNPCCSSASTAPVE